jgi:hypothetical protein
LSGSTQHTFESHGDQDETTLAIGDAPGGGREGWSRLVSPTSYTAIMAKRRATTDDLIWALNPFTKVPMRVKRSSVEDEAKVREALRKKGFDPDTGEPLARI